jgi:hypothetical protein
VDSGEVEVEYNWFAGSFLQNTPFATLAQLVERLIRNRIKLVFLSTVKKRINTLQALVSCGFRLFPLTSSTKSSTKVNCGR